MTHPSKPGDTALEGPAPQWVDYHVLLNSLALLRYRMEAGRTGTLDFLDAINGYLACGLELGRRQSCSTFDELQDWFANLVFLVRQNNPRLGELRCVGDIEDDETRFDLRPLAPGCARVLAELVAQGAAATPATLQWRLQGRLAELTLVPSSPDAALASSAAQPQPLLSVQLDRAG